MSKKNNRKFFLGIVIPSVLAVALFIIAIYAILIPRIEKNSMERKKEMISELTNTAWSLIDEYNKEVKDSLISIEDAQKYAASRVSEMRYGKEQKDYFWIIDMSPKMIIHPYRPELNGTDLSDYADPKGKKLFVEAVKLVKEDGEGFIDYMWQWKDDSSRIVPKLSYVKEFPEWGWIVGTGIYLEDVKEEISYIKNRLLLISSIIVLLLGLLLLFIIRQSLKIENKRHAATKELLVSRQRYKTLVEASAEGTIMLQKKEIIFCNKKTAEIIGIERKEIYALSLNKLFDLNWTSIEKRLSKEGKTFNIPVKIKTGVKEGKEVLLSISQLTYAAEKSFIIIVKEIDNQKIKEEEKQQLIIELEQSSHLMMQKSGDFSTEILRCSTTSSIQKAAELMKSQKQSAIFVMEEEEVIWIVSSKDISERMAALQLKGEEQITKVMTSPVFSISENTSIQEAIRIFKKNNFSHLLIDKNNGKKEVLERKACFLLLNNSISSLVEDIETANNIQELKKIFLRAAIIVEALYNSGSKAETLTRIISTVADHTTKRLFDFAFDQYGTAPCKFSFIAMGSEARMEQSLHTDQDNAIIFENVKAEEKAKTEAYFLKIASYITNSLDEIGFKRCPGNNMASNPKWCKSIEEWKNYFSKWISESDPQSILEINIFFDFRTVYGESTFTEELFEHIIQKTQGKTIFFHHLMQSTLKFKAPLNNFGNIVGETENENEKWIDVKKLLMPIISMARLYSIKNGIKENHTIERLQQVLKTNDLQAELFAEIIQAYNYLFLLRFRAQLEKINAKTAVSNDINVLALTEIETATLKKIFSKLNEIQSKASMDFN